MAVRHRLIRTTPQTVWSVLADGNRYAEWVVGTSQSHPVRGRWPQKDAAIGYEARLGPVRLANETVVRRCEEGSVLELEAYAGRLGSARIAIELRPWGEHTLVLVDEHPMQGAAGRFHNVAVEALIQLRHRAMLARLAGVCEAEGRSERPASRRGAAPAAAPGRGGVGHA